MKNRLFILFLIFFVLTLNSCYQKSKTINITDFSHSLIDTLQPNKKGPYSAALIKIKGFPNDTIKITYYGIEKKYCGNFERSMNMDYYGGIDVIFKFDPYKATKGELEINYGIY